MMHQPRVTLVKLLRVSAQLVAHAFDIKWINDVKHVLFNANGLVVCRLTETLSYVHYNIHAIDACLE